MKMDRKEKFTPGPWRTNNYCDQVVTAYEPTSTMYELLDKCESCIRHLLDGPVDDPVIGEAENTIQEIFDLLKKARGEE